MLTLVDGADLDAALAVMGRQAYEPKPSVVVVGEVDQELPDAVGAARSLDVAISDAPGDVDYLWLVHADARPRPDALGALVSELDRSEGALAGSKLLVAGTENELESVGSATDVFGEPYTGLDEGEIDLQQYDVVREVAFVASASMLVRRDLAQGLGGLDPLLPPVAAGLDFSQRARLAGGRVISVPSSEVYHQGRCEERGRGWREQAGRLRSMLKAYSPVTLSWVVPYELVVSVLDSVANLVLLRWRPAAGYLRSLGWNLLHLPSTLAQRRRFKPVRVARDEELFRFQARGSIRLRETGAELSGRILSVFDDDQALARGTRRIWASPGIWGAVVAALMILVSARAIFFEGVPNNGFSFPFEAPGDALDRWFAGWSDSGLGSPTPVHPSVGLTGALSWLWFGAEGAARTLLTIGFGLVGVVGMGRLASRLGLRGPGRYLAGIVLLGGPGTALLTGSGSWVALGAAAVLPWAIRPALTRSSRAGLDLSQLGQATLMSLLLAAFSPPLAAAPLIAVAVWSALGGKGGRIVPAVAALLGGVAAAGFVTGDPGFLLDAERRLGLYPDVWWFVLILAGVVALALGGPGRERVGILGGVVSFGALAVVATGELGPGLEEAALILSSLGAALVVAAGLDSWSKGIGRLAAVGASAAILAVSLGPLGNGRLGLPAGDVNESLAFSATLAGQEGPGRILVASESRAEVPGEERPGPGFWYRVVDGSGMTHDEVWLPPPSSEDADLERAIGEIASGSTLRPGALLAGFGIRWVVVTGEESDLDLALSAQLDLLPTPLDPSARVFDNPLAGPVPNLRAAHEPSQTDVWGAALTAGLLVISAVGIVVGRMRR